MEEIVINGCSEENGAHKDLDLESTGRSDICEGSEGVIEDPVGVKEVAREGKKEILLAEEFVENGVSEVSPATSLDTGIEESHLVNNNEESLEEQANGTSVSDVMGNGKHGDLASVQGGLQVDGAQSVAAGDDRPAENVSEAEKTHEEDRPVSNGELIVQNDRDFGTCGIPLEITKSETETGLGEVSPATSMDTDIESHLVNDGEGTLEEQANEASVSDAIGDGKHEHLPFVQIGLQVDEAQSVQGGLQADEAQSVVAGDDRPAEIVSEVVENTYEEDRPVTNGELIVQTKGDSEKHSDTCGIPSEITKSGTETGLSEVSPATSMDTGIEPHLVNNNEGTLEEQANEAAVLDAKGNQKHEDLPSVEGGLQVDEAQSVAAGDDRPVETVTEVLENTYEEDRHVSNGELIVQNNRDSDICGIPLEINKSETETGLSEVSPATSMDTDIKSHVGNNSEGTLEEQENEAIDSDVIGNQKHEDLPSIEGGLLVDEAQSVAAGDDRPAGTVSEVLEKTYEEDRPVSHGNLIIQNNGDSEKHSVICEIPSEITKSETGPSEVSPATSMDTEIDFHLVNNKEGTLEEQANEASASDAIGNQKHEDLPSVQGVLQVDEAQSVVAVDDRPAETVSEVLEKTSEEDKPASHGELIVQNDGDSEITKSGTETGSSKVSPATSMDTDIESHLVHNSEGTLEEQANESIVGDVMGNQKHEVLPSIQGELLQVDEAQAVASGDDKSVETVCEVIEKAYEEDRSVSHGELIDQSDRNPEEHSETCGTEIELSPLSQSSAASSAREPQGEIGVPNEETAEETTLAHVDGIKLQIVETDLTDRESSPVGTKNDDAISESSSVPGLVVSVISAETETTSLNGDVNVEAEELIVKPEVNSDPPAAADVKLESEVHESGAASNVGKVSDVAAGLDVKSCDSAAVLETENIEDVDDQVDSGRNNDENLVQENKGVENSKGDNISLASPEGARETNSGEVPLVTKPFNYVMKVPRFNDDILKEQIRQAKLQVEEKTKLRDAIQRQIQQIRANGQIHGVDYEYAKGENRNARKLVRLKRMEIDSLQSVINKAKNAISIGDIDSRIYNVEHMIQHETLPLKEEKQLIREIKQLRGLRGELSSNMGTEEEIKQALDQREEAEERLKSLRKELELLKGEVLKTEAATVEAGTKYDNEIRKVRELQVQYRAANDVRQEVYARWLSLRKELSEKNKHFFKYRDDAAAASNYAFCRDTESLYRLCTDQVEKVMELWNTNDEFRKDYISFNTRNTIRRFGTLDGRVLGPDEEPIVLPSYVDERVNRVVSTPAKVDLVSQGPPEPKLEATIENETLADLSSKKTTEHKNLTLKSKKSVEPVLANGLATVHSLDAPDEVQEEPVKSREEIELDRKAEELRKKEAEAKLKEQRRLEGLAKANEARERKKRQAEKIQMRAELKARKEAEEKEKEREKRLRKKERKKVGATDSNDGNTNSDSAPSSESAIEASREIDAAKDVLPCVVPKKHQKYLKQNKAKSSIPPPLRNRNRKKWQQYAYVTAAGLLVVVLFWVGNISLFSNKTLRRQNPFY